MSVSFKKFKNISKVLRLQQPKKKLQLQVPFEVFEVL